MIEFDTALLLLAGAFIGWHVPQPLWAKFISAKVAGVWAKIKARFTS